MKTLLLMRHGKSSWDDPSIDDFNRPLNERGLRDTPLIAKYIKNSRIKPDIIISSSANRAKSTADLVAVELSYPKDKLIYKDSLYLTTAGFALDFLSELDDAYKTVLLVGHNPFISQLTSFVTGSPTLDIPTAGVAAIEFDIDSWKELSTSKGSLLFLQFPKNLKNI